MPHLVIEYTASLGSARAERLLDAAHHALVGSGVFDAKDVKSRALPLALHRMGDTADGVFVHALLHLIEGRSEDVRGELAAAVVRAMAEALSGELPQGTQLSCDVREIPAATYAKRVVG